MQVRQATLFDLVRCSQLQMTPVGGTPALTEQRIGRGWLTMVLRLVSGRDRWLVNGGERRPAGVVELHTCSGVRGWQVARTSLLRVREGWLEETLQVASEIAGAQGVERLSAGVVEHDVRLAAFEDSGFRPIVRETLYIRRGGQVSMPDERLGMARLFSVRDTLAMLRLFTVAIPAVVRQQLSTPEQLLHWMRSRYAVVVRSEEEIQVAIGVRQRSDLGHAVVQLWMTEQGVAMGPVVLDAVVERLRREGFEAVWLVVPEYDEKAAEVARYVHFAPVTERLQMLRHTTALVRQPAFQRLSESVKGKGVQVAEGPTLSARPLRPTVHAAVCNSQRSARDRVRGMAGRVR